MIESAAQLLSFYVKEIFGLDAFIGFSGIESATFRLPVTPGQRLLLLGNLHKVRSRKYYAYVQGVVDGKFVFDATVSGMKV
jgi:3-hydroxymyristoyl/3-hydroxydecanoyl-(acyl carrier protein) dehydratase